MDASLNAPDKSLVRVQFGISGFLASQILPTVESEILLGWVLKKKSLSEIGDECDLSPNIVSDKIEEAFGVLENAQFMVRVIAPDYQQTEFSLAQIFADPVFRAGFFSTV